MLRALPLFGAMSIVLAASDAAYAAPTAQLVYSRAVDAASCPDEQALRSAVAARVGYDPFFAIAPRKVVATVVKRGAYFVATVDLVDPQGFTHGGHEVRTPRDCGELLDSVALSIAIAIDPHLMIAPAPAPKDAAPSEPPVQPAPPPVVVEAPPQASDVPVTPTQTPPPFSGEADLGLVVSSGVAPATSLGVAAGLRLRWRALSLGLEGRIDAPASVAPGEGGSVSSWLVLGALVPCAHVGALFGCGVYQEGSMQTRSSGVSDIRTRSVAWSAAGGRLGVRLPLSEPLEIQARADLVADLRRATFVLDGGIAWEAPRVAGSGAIDVVLHFW